MVVYEEMVNTPPLHPVDRPEVDTTGMVDDKEDDEALLSYTAS
jgi:hypothetical protein